VSVPEQRRLWIRWALGFAVALVLAIIAALVADARHPSGSPRPLVLAGDSVVVVDPRTDTVVAEIPVGGRPVGPAIAEGVVWVGNRDDKTLLKIDASSRDVVHRIGLGVVPTDVEVGAGSAWVLSDEALLRVDAAVNDVVEKIPLPQRPGLRWTHIEVAPNAVYVCRCSPLPGDLLRVDATTSEMSTYPRPVGSIAYGEGGLWALAGYESDSFERIDAETNAVDAIPIGRIGELHGYRARIAVGEGATWVVSQQSLWRIDPATKRLLGSVHLGPRAEGSVAAGAGAVWIMSFSDRALLRVDPDSETVAKTIPFGALIYPVSPWDGIAVGDGFVWIAVTSYAS